MSVTWLKLWRHVWQSLKLLVKSIDTSSTGFKMEVLEEINLSSHDAEIPWSACAIVIRDLKESIK